MLFDAEDRPVPVGEVGEIVCRPKRSHVMFEGYDGRDRETVEQFRNLWFHTGDMGRFDEDGFFYFADRKKDAMRRRGENISSFEVEQALLRHPAVAEVAAVGVPSELGEDDVMVYRRRNRGRVDRHGGLHGLLLRAPPVLRCSALRGCDAGVAEECGRKDPQARIACPRRPFLGLGPRSRRAIPSADEYRYPSLPIASTRGMAHGEQLSRIARKYPARTAYICQGESRTFEDVDRRVTALANALTARGLQHGDRLAVLMMNSIEMIETIFAGWRLGAIVVPVNFRLVADEVRFILGDCGASVIVVDEGLLPWSVAVRETLPTDVDAVIVVGGPDGVPVREPNATTNCLRWRPTPVTSAVDEQDPALIMYTSGTTGRPKGAVLSHFNLLMSTLNSMVAQGIVGLRRRLVRQPPAFPHRGPDGDPAVCHRRRLRHHRPQREFRQPPSRRGDRALRVTGCVFVGMQWDDICDQVTASRRAVVLAACLVGRREHARWRS